MDEQQDWTKHVGLSDLVQNNHISGPVQLDLCFCWPIELVI